MPTRRNLLAALALAPLLPQRPAAQALYLPPSGLALEGHDAVAYFREGAPRAGEARFALEWSGAVWRFASAANRDAFAAEPERHAPRYGGHCAWAMAQGYRAPGRPLHWALVEGALYVNFDASVQRRWLRDVPGFIVAADRHWPALRGA